MNNVIPITHSNLEITSIRPRSSVVSPLKTRDPNLQNRNQRNQSMIRPNITHSEIYQTDNNYCITQNSSKKKIVLKKNKNYNSDNKKNNFQQHQKLLYATSLRQAHHRLRNSKQYLHISIDLDKIRSQQKKQDKVRNHGNLKKMQTELKKYQTQNIEAKMVQFKKEKRQEDESLFQAVNLRSTYKKSGRKHSSKQIKEKILNKWENNYKNSYRSKSQDTILRKEQNQRNKQEDSKKNNISKIHSNEVNSILIQQQSLKSLFKKLTKKNLPYENWINYINLTYQELTIEELHFIGILLQRVQPKYLNCMNYLTFKFKIYQNCQKEFQELMLFQNLKG